MFCYGVKIAKKERILTLKFEYQSRVPVQFLKVSIKDKTLWLAQQLHKRVFKNH